MDTAAIRKYIADPPADPQYVAVLLDKLLEACNEIDESNDLLLSCAEQFLMTDDDGIIMHSFMSTEEELCRVLVARGILKEVSRAKFQVITKSNVKDHRARSAPVHQLVGQVCPREPNEHR
jgi:hypothetical protein